MSLSANIDHLAIAAGIEAVVVDTGPREYRGDEKWHRVLDGAVDLFRRTDERSIRLVVGKHTIVVQQEADETVAVVLPTGHAIAKSLRRMIRRMARKDRGPLPKEFMAGYSDYDYADQAANERRPAAMGGANPSPFTGAPSNSSPVHSTPSPSPVSSPLPSTPTTPTSTPSPNSSNLSSNRGAKAGEEVEREPSRPDRTGSERGGFHNF